jgi:hypothetical protein
MVKRRTIQWSKEDGQYNGQTKADNIMVKRRRTIQWSKEDGQYNGQKKTDNTMVKRRRTIQWSKEDLYCPSSFDHCIVRLLLTIVLSVFF